MPVFRTPRGITPPAPGLEREEPTFVNERDLPDGEGRKNVHGEGTGEREERPPRKLERE